MDNIDKIGFDKFVQLKKLPSFRNRIHFEYKHFFNVWYVITYLDHHKIIKMIPFDELFNIDKGTLSVIEASLKDDKTFRDHLLNAAFLRHLDRINGGK